jgi:hypothetical protein
MQNQGQYGAFVGKGLNLLNSDWSVSERDYKVDIILFAHVLGVHIYRKLHIVEI